VVAVTSDGGRPSTVASDDGERIDGGERWWSRIDGGRELMVAVTLAVTSVARFKRS